MSKEILSLYFPFVISCIVTEFLLGVGGRRHPLIEMYGSKHYTCETGGYSCPNCIAYSTYDCLGECILYNAKMRIPGLRLFSWSELVDNLSTYYTSCDGSHINMLISCYNDKQKRLKREYKLFHKRVMEELLFIMTALNVKMMNLFIALQNAVGNCSTEKSKVHLIEMNKKVLKDAAKHLSARLNEGICPSCGHEHKYKCWNSDFIEGKHITQPLYIRNKDVGEIKAALGKFSPNEFSELRGALSGNNNSDSQKAIELSLQDAVTKAEAKEVKSVIDAVTKGEPQSIAGCSSKQWSCSVYTFHNPEHLSFCDICRTPRTQG